MNFNRDLAEKNLESILTSFPNLKQSLGQIKNEALLIGAIILHFYKTQDWIIDARGTGDIDLSIGITPSFDEYSAIKNQLIKDGYSENDEMKYRLERITKNVSAKIDLLVHPKETFDEKSARELMGVGDEWNFEGIRYGLIDSYHIINNIYIPNPIGFLGLKAFSFHGDPRRVRDLVDICDVIKGFVSKGIHYDLVQTYSDMNKQCSQSHKFVHSMLEGLTNPESTDWDLNIARQEFLQRGYSPGEIDGTMNLVAKEFLEALE